MTPYYLLETHENIIIQVRADPRVACVVVGEIVD
jgi:hypothetical protein